MSRILIAGLVNVETTLCVHEFPVPYQPIDYPFFGINSAVSGVAMNVAAALSALGDEIRLTSLVAKDEEGIRVRRHFADRGWSDRYIYDRLKATPQTIVLFDDEGRRRCYCDLKDMQEQSCPDELADELLDGVDAAVICNTNFARPLLAHAKRRNVPIITDVHVLSDINDEYNADFIRAADVLFLSDERLPDDVEGFVSELSSVSDAKIIVVGLGKKGALLWQRENNEFCLVDAVYTRPVVNTVGAGDSLLSAFSHYYIKGKTAHEALKRAAVFASYKIGENGAAKGFADEKTVESFIK